MELKDLSSSYQKDLEGGGEVLKGLKEPSVPENQAVAFSPALGGLATTRVRSQNGPIVALPFPMPGQRSIRSFSFFLSVLRQLDPASVKGAELLGSIVCLVKPKAFLSGCPLCLPWAEHGHLPQTCGLILYQTWNVTNYRHLHFFLLTAWIPEQERYFVYSQWNREVIQ